MVERLRDDRRREPDPPGRTETDTRKKRSQEGNTAVDLPPGGVPPAAGGPSVLDDEDQARAEKRPRDRRDRDEPEPQP